MKKCIVIPVLLFGASTLFAQSKQDTLYYDANWKGVESKTFATYYRIVSENADANFGKRYRDYYVTGELQSEGKYISIDKYDDSKSVKDGEWTNYYKSGKVEQKGRKVNGTDEGEYTSYYENGLVKRHCTMKNGKPDGILTEFDETGDVCTQTEMMNGSPLYDYYIRSNKDGYGGKFRISDNTPIWESPSQQEMQTEYRDGAAWLYYIKNGLLVSINNNQVKDYGKWFQISVVVSNNSIAPIDFDPAKITSTLKKTNGEEVAMEVYSAEKYMRKVQKAQNWSMALTGIAEGLAAASAGHSSSTTHSNSFYDSYSSSYGSSHSYDRGKHSYGSYDNGSSFHGKVSTVSHTDYYDGAAAYQAQVIACDRMANYENALLQEREIKQEGYLKRTTVYPGQAISGYINIKRSKGDSMYVVVDINGAKYGFPWSIAK